MKLLFDGFVNGAAKNFLKIGIDGVLYLEDLIELRARSLVHGGECGRELGESHLLFIEILGFNNQVKLLGLRFPRFYL